MSKEDIFLVNAFATFMCVFSVVLMMVGGITQLFLDVQFCMTVGVICLSTGWVFVLLALTEGSMSRLFLACIWFFNAFMWFVVIPR